MDAADNRDPWFRLEGESARRFEREAATEIAPGHELYGHALETVAKCEGCNSVVFRVSDGTFAIVQLSWIRKPDARPWPPTTRLGGFVAVDMVMAQHGH